MPLVASGLLADYRCDEGSGTVLHDSSPHAYDSSGYTGSFPAWSAAGLTFGGGGSIQVPVPIGSVVTVQLAYTTNVSDPGGAGRWVLGSDNTSVGWCQTSGGNLPTAENGYVPRPGCYPTDPGCQDFFVQGAPNLITYRHTAGSNQLYINDVVCETGNALASPAGFGGNLYFGGSSSYVFNGTLHRAVLYNRVLTDAETLANYAAIKSDLAARGVALKGPNPTANRELVVEGDSITYGYTTGGRLATPWPAGMTLTDTYERWNMGANGQLLAHMLSHGYDRNSVLLQADWARNAATVFGGTNDFGSRSAPAIFADLKALVAKYRQKCGLVVVVPMLSRVGSDANKNAYNALMSSEWGAGAVPGVVLVPSSAMPHLVPDGSSADATYFGDGTHPTQAGADEIAGAVAAAINGGTFAAPPAPAPSATAPRLALLGAG